MLGSSRRLRDGGASGRVEHPAAEQLESGATVHGALDRLQPADLTLDRTRRPPRLERGPDGREVLPEALGEAPERRPGRGREPLVQRSRPLLPDQGGEVAGEAADLGQGGRLGEQPVEERAVRARQLARVGLDQAGSPSYRGRLPAVRGRRRHRVERVRCGPTAPRGPCPHRRPAAFEAQADELLPQPRRVARAFGPAPLQVVLVGLQDPGARRPVPSPGPALTQPLAHGLAVETAGPRGRADRRAGVAQPPDLRVAGLARLVPGRLPRLPRRGGRGRLRGGSTGLLPAATSRPARRTAAWWAPTAVRTASPRLRSRCQRSATWTACGAPRRAPSA